MQTGSGTISGGDTLGVTAAIGIICKAPKPGATKSRLAAAIGPDAAAELSSCFLQDVAAAIEAVPEDIGRCGYGVYAPAGTEKILRRLFPPSFGLLLRTDADLGNVLFAANFETCSPRRTTACFSSTATVRRYRQPFSSRPSRRCECRATELVLGPASDGGYYLIGLKHPHPEVFSRIEWSTPSVARTTLQRAQEIALETTLLPEWYDIDDAETFRWLRDELAGRLGRFLGGGPARATRAYLGSAREAVW